MKIAVYFIISKNKRTCKTKITELKAGNRLLVSFTAVWQNMISGK